MQEFNGITKYHNFTDIDSTFNFQALKAKN